MRYSAKGHRRVKRGYSIGDEEHGYIYYADCSCGWGVRSWTKHRDKIESNSFHEFRHHLMRVLMRVSKNETEASQKNFT